MLLLEGVKIKHKVNSIMKFLMLHFILTITARVSITSARCLTMQPGSPKYYLIEKCHRSKLGIAAKAKYTSLESCKKLAIEKKALSLNYSPISAVNGEPLEFNCEVLKCAESYGGLSLVNDTRFDYYSIYGRPLPVINSTCVPATGMFNLINMQINYTQAVTQCRNISSVLPDVSTELRTDALGQVLAGAGVHAAFAGMKRTNGSNFIFLNGDSLDCSTYRAWAPGHPKRDKFECVLITSQRTWKTVPCKTKMQVLCELLPGGPYKVGSIFVFKNLE